MLNFFTNLYSGGPRKLRPYFTSVLFFAAALTFSSCAKEKEPAPKLVVNEKTLYARIADSGLKLFGTQTSSNFENPTVSGASALITEKRVEDMETAISRGKFNKVTELIQVWADVDATQNGVSWTVGMDGANFRVILRPVEKGKTLDTGKLELIYLKK